MLKWQKKVFSDSTRFKVVAAGRRCGKSRLSAVTLLIEGMNCPAGSAVMYIAPTIGAARVIIWDLLHELGRDLIKSSHQNNLEIVLTNGRKILIRGADNPDSLRGVSLTYCVIDEAAFVKAEVWEKIIRASLSDQKGRALFISTPAARNWFYDIFKLGTEESDEDWKAWHFTTADNETIDPKEIAAAKRTLSTFVFKSEYQASFDNAGSDLFKEEYFKTGAEPKYGEYIIAFDVANHDTEHDKGKTVKRLDHSAIAVVKVEDSGDWWVHSIAHGRWDWPDMAARLIRNIKQFKPIAMGTERGILKNVIMQSLEAAMRKNNTYMHVTTLTHGNRKKVDRIATSLQGRFEHSCIKFNDKEDWTVFKDEMIMFPTAGVRDDLIDALSYVDQLAPANYNAEYEEETHEVLDVIVGF
jgi:hypothetical protein